MADEELPEGLRRELCRVPETLRCAECGRELCPGCQWCPRCEYNEHRLAHAEAGEDCGWWPSDRDA